MNQINETTIDVLDVGSILDERCRTDLEFYNKLSLFIRKMIAAKELQISYQELKYMSLVEANTVEKPWESLVNSTRPIEPPEDIEQQVEAAFNEAEDQDFEDGMESTFSRELLSLIRKYGVRAMLEISYLITYKKVSYEVSSEALRWLGRMIDPLTYSYRLWLLKKSLNNASARVRDGAALGLASIGNPDAIPSLKEAIAQEKCIELREDLEQVLEELEAAHHATIPKNDTKE